MRIATWNVNSIRTRIDRVTDWLQRSQVDVLALQETKCKEDQFPFEQLKAIGYESAVVGLNQWNGAAIVSRVGIEDVEVAFENQPKFKDAVEPRAIGATCGGVRVWSLYVPHGRSLEDPHFAYKIDWLAALRANAELWLQQDPTARIALMGDWNIAPLDEDVWDIKVFEGSTHVSEPERSAFQSFIDTGFTDVVRPFTPGPGIYTYWDYQQLRFPKKEGMRIDFVLCSPELTKMVTHAEIDRDERKGKGASDHVPVVVDLD